MQGYFEAFFKSTTTDWKHIYTAEKMKFFLNRKLHIYAVLSVTRKNINRKYHSFQYKILSDILSLNKIFFKFGKVKSPLCSFFKSVGKKNDSFSDGLWAQYNRIKLRPSFQTVLLSLMTHRRLPFLVLQTPVLNTFYW